MPAEPFLPKARGFAAGQWVRLRRAIPDCPLEVGQLGRVRGGMPIELVAVETYPFRQDLPSLASPTDFWEDAESPYRTAWDWLLETTGGS